MIGGLKGAIVGGTLAFLACAFVLWGLPATEHGWQAFRYFILAGAAVGIVVYYGKS